MGDRVLAIFLAPGYYQYSTNDYRTNTADVSNRMTYGDIEGVWTYTYFSYSILNKAAVAFLNNDG